MMNFPKFLNILSPRYLCNYSKMVKKKKINKHLTDLGLFQHSLATNRKTFPKPGLVFHLFITKHRAQTVIVNGYPNGKKPG